MTYVQGRGKSAGVFLRIGKYASKGAAMVHMRKDRKGGRKEKERTPAVCETYSVGRRRGKLHEAKTKVGCRK